MHKFFFRVFLLAAFLVSLRSNIPPQGNAKPSEIDDLPLKIYNSANSKSSTMVFMISGDGGWNSFDQHIAALLSAKSYPIVGLDSKHYFWSEKQPQVFTREFSTVMNYYLKEWKCNNLVLIGYSFGADVVPFLVNRLSADLSQKIKLVVLLSPDEWAEYEVHIGDMLHIRKSKEINNVRDEAVKMKKKTLFIFGSEEEHSAFDHLPAPLFRQMIISGGHHFDENYGAIVNGILATLND